MKNSFEQGPDLNNEELSEKEDRWLIRKLDKEAKMDLKILRESFDKDEFDKYMELYKKFIRAFYDQKATDTTAENSAKEAIRKFVGTLSSEKRYVYEHLNEKRQETIQAQNNMGYHKLNEEQYKRWLSLMSDKETLPESLREKLNDVSKKYGASGEVIGTTIADWIKKQK